MATDYSGKLPDDGSDSGDSHIDLAGEARPLVWHPKCQGHSALREFDWVDDYVFPWNKCDAPAQNDTPDTEK